jgi:asparagine synthase (glutamine-hydrolysing)
MPGLVGLITRIPKDHAEITLLRMVEAMRHEASDVAGTWNDVSLGLYVGWVERSGTCNGSMPLRNERDDLRLIFSGEEFPGPGTATALRERGHSLNLVGPEYLVHLAEEKACLPCELKGQIQGVLADYRGGSVTLFNDRYGLHRIYYRESAETFYFAAEAKAILAVQQEPREVDEDGVGEIICCGCALENRTIYKNIKLLPPASEWRFERARLIERRTYFDARKWNAQTRLDPEPFYQQLRSVFSRNLPRYFGNSQRIGISLTGGLDSRMIMAWAKAMPDRFTCYSFGGMYRESEDVKIARKVARACGLPHEVIEVGRDFLKEFARYAERTVYLTDGCVEVKYAPDLYANERAAAIAPIRVTGNYGSEILRNVRAFRPDTSVAGIFSQDMAATIQRAEKTYQNLPGLGTLPFILSCQMPWHHYGLRALEQTQLEMRSPFLDNELVETMCRAPEASRIGDNVSLRLIADGDAALRGIPTDRGLGGRPWVTSMLASAWQSFTFKAEYAYDYGMPQPLARIDGALSHLHMERLFLGRHKFTHFRVWYRDALAAYVREMLLDERTLSRPYIERKKLKNMVEQHLSGRRNYTAAIHKILTLEYIHRLFIDSQ